MIDGELMIAAILHASNAKSGSTEMGVYLLTMKLIKKVTGCVKNVG